MKKTVQVIMLPTKDNQYFSGIVQHFGINNHLYFTSNEEIKEGDKVLESFTNSIMTIKRLNGKQVFFNETDKYTNLLGVSKVIATTDKSLNLPLIPQLFIEEYVKSNGEIKEVEYDYEEGQFGHTHIKWETIDKDNEGLIYITPPKKQTLEEAAEEYFSIVIEDIYPKDITSSDMNKAFIAGAKWQQSNS